MLKMSKKVPMSLDLVRLSMTVSDPTLHVRIKTLNCPNPVGLAGGFDKGAELINVLPSLGFGFAEVGTLTPLPQSGQERPRLFRYKAQKALVNRMGFNNPGVKVAADRLKNRLPGGIPIGVNIGKGRETPIDEAVEDYQIAFDAVAPYADYVVLNVSSPNTAALRELQSVKYLATILSSVSAQNKRLAEKDGQPPKPLFVKVAPDNTDEVLEEIVRTCVETGVGIVATNTTLDHSSLGSRAKKETGGLSGKPVHSLSNKCIGKVYQWSKGVIPIIGVGGIFTAKDAYEKIRLGASLIQVYTGWVYEGPGLVPKINKGLLEFMKRDGFKRIQDAVGTL
jgi:dihydroorotate dehydrogenase